MKIVPVLLFTLFLCCSHAAAQHRWFQPSELYSSAVIALARDPGGALWAAVADPVRHPTPFAVQRFDGERWITISTADYDYPLPAASRLWDIAADGSGNILVAAERHLLRFDQSAQRWSSFRFDDSLENERDFHHVLVDSRGRVWLSAVSRTVLGRNMIGGGEVRSVIPYLEMFRFEDGRLRKILSWPDMGFRFTNPAEDSKGAIWLAYQRTGASAPGGLLKFIGDSATVVDVPRGSTATAGPMIRCLFIDSQDRIHIGSSYRADLRGRTFPPSVTTISPDFTTYSEQIFPPAIFGYYELTTLMEHEGELYAGTEGGLFKFIGDTIQMIDFRRYFPEFAAQNNLHAIHAIVPTADSLYCATSWGVVMLDSVETLSGVKMTASGSIRATAAPNPVRDGGGTTIEMSFGEDDALGDILLLNSTGREIAATMTPLGGSSIRLDTRGLSAGAYFVRVRSRNGAQQMVRFVVEK